MTSAMKASQAISSEILFPQLVANLIHVVMESAGAQRGVLVLRRGKDFIVEASGEVGSRDGPLEPAQPLAQSRIALPGHRRAGAAQRRARADR